ncbi:MAG: aldo/keto reductase [Spirochaetota bacterium]
MKETKLSTTGIQASRIGLGTWAIGGWMWGGSEEEPAIATVQRALETGITLIDTAPVYGFGKSEELIGRALQNTARESFVLATKTGIEWDDDGNVFRNASKDRIRREIEDSLQRLGLEYIDVYQVHWPDPNVPIEATAEAMRELYDEGLIRAVGVSNFSIDQMNRFMEQSPLHTCQPPYNLFEREIENGLKPFCERNGIALITYGALCRGLLTGKLDENSSFEGDDLRNVDPKFQQPRYSQYLQAVERFTDLAAQYDRSTLQLAVNWILQQGVQVALWGARKPSQLDQVGAAVDWSISPEDMQEIEKILKEEISSPIGPDFMAPPSRD